MSKESTTPTTLQSPAYHRDGDGRALTDAWLTDKNTTSAFFGVSLITLDRWEHQGCPVYKQAAKTFGAKKLYYLPDVADWRINAGFTKGNKGQPLDLGDKGRLTKAKAALEELKLAEKQGVVIPTALVLKAWAEAMSILRTRLLSLGPRLGPILAPSMTAVKVEQLITDDVTNALDEVSGAGLPADIRDLARAAVAAGSSSSPSAAKADDKPVG